MPRILLVGNAVLDIILRVAHHPAEDEEMRALSRRSDLGGNAANSARVLAALSHRVALLATLAADGEAEELRRLLDAAGVDTRHLVRVSPPGGRTPLSTILLHAASGARTIVHHRDLEEPRFEEFRALPLAEFDWIHFEGRNVAEARRMLAYLDETGHPARVSLEVEKDRPEIETLLPHADLLLFSRAYAEARGYPDAAALLADMRRHAPAALLACAWGAAGAWGLDASGRATHCPAQVPPTVVDTLGAGDVFNAGMIDALLAGAWLEAALARATRLAGRKVGQTGFDGLGLPSARLADTAA